uniref:Uncharacterized protein n=1 Tax=Caenorhabditis japonica TaxID=281687 RepID=A0A8R1IDG9_CAEJA
MIGGLQRAAMQVRSTEVSDSACINNETLLDRFRWTEWHSTSWADFDGPNGWISRNQMSGFRGTTAPEIDTLNVSSSGAHLLTPS